MESVKNEISGIIQKCPPVCFPCTDPVLGYHGTTVANANLILESNTFNSSIGRVGKAVYFYIGEGGYSAAMAHAKERHGDNFAILSAIIDNIIVFDTESVENERLINSATRVLRSHAARGRLESFFAHEHMAAQLILDLIRDTETIIYPSVVRTTFSASGIPNQGLAVLGGSSISGIRLIRTD